MYHEMTKGKIPIRMWIPPHEVESGALDQALNLANHPKAFHHIALMPDVHVGYGAPIGAVTAMTDVVSPNHVGVDIGCGMVAARTEMKIDDFPKSVRKTVINKMRDAIPTGFRHHEDPHPDWMPEPVDLDAMPIVKMEWTSATKQVGSLGSGNHFAELQYDEDGNVWVMIHSGSRNLGKQVADHYIFRAEQFNVNEGHLVPPSWDLAYLPVDSDEGQAYIREMNYCLEFSKANRRSMLDAVGEILSEETPFIGFVETININHNDAKFEKHFGEMVWVHRKGATPANPHEMGIIPGDQGSKSYIVEGLGNPDSFKSCSHGAGRCLGRNKAVKTLDLAEQVKLMDDQDIVHGIRSDGDLDEAPGAYKDIDQVIENERDLVDVRVTLRPAAVLKGESRKRRKKKPRVVDGDTED
jgi:tRNA-splicing ligase RtcB